MPTRFSCALISLGTPMIIREFLVLDSWFFVFWRVAASCLRTGSLITDYFFRRGEPKLPLVPARLLRGLGEELEPRAVGAGNLAPQGRAAFQVEHLSRGLADQPRALRQLSFELAFAPARIAHESAH